MCGGMNTTAVECLLTLGGFTSQRGTKETVKEGREEEVMKKRINANENTARKHVRKRRKSKE